MRLAKDNLTKDHELFVRLAIDTLNRETGHVCYGADERINEREAIMACINACERDGMVWVSQSGMDCDCVQFTGSYAIQIPATLQAYWGYAVPAYEHAEGRMSISISASRPSHNSRDLALEAFEDGHQHVVYA